jgi:hypothetical protein
VFDKAFVGGQRRTDVDLKRDWRETSPAGSDSEFPQIATLTRADHEWSATIAAQFDHQERMPE